METISALRKRALLLEPAVRVGKKGLTPSVISEIDALLSKRGLVKVKMLRASLGGESSDDEPEIPVLSKDELSVEGAKKTHSILVQQVGLTFTLYRKPTVPKSPGASKPSMS